MLQFEEKNICENYEKNMINILLQFSFNNYPLERRRKNNKSTLSLA